ncbi:MAG: SAM-dependent methyltransferase [Opitutae bacterium]
MTERTSPRDDFLGQLTASVRDGSMVKLTLGKARSADASLRNLLVRPILLRGLPHCSFVWRHERQDITKNYPLEESLTLLAPLIGSDFHSAHLFTPSRLAQLEYNKKGEPRLTYGPPQAEATDLAHDRPKTRVLTEQSQSWLHALGVTTATGAVREGMADKHRQIHKFVEILSHLAAAAALPTHRPLEIADMGCGKGYLTFATHDYFNLIAARPANVQGVEFRPELVQQCNAIALAGGRPTLRFTPGTIQSAIFPTLDGLIALHACDTATDDALAKGVQAGAALLVVAPCCQKELRSQLTAAPVLAPALRHGIFQERQAEFATDALRALLLEWAGYDTKVFEFISSGHTAKNTMIAATKHQRPARTEEAAQRVRDFAAFYGVKTQALARQLYFDLGP